MKSCAMCKAVKPLSAFHKQPSGPKGRHSYCKDCYASRYNGVRKRNEDPAKKAALNYKRRYGLSTEQVQTLLDVQGGVCAICGMVPKRPCVDHSHTTGKVRGVLCHGCNIKLPAVEDVSFLSTASAYLASSK